MVGKLYVLAFLCLALPLVRGEDLEEAKKQALSKLGGKFAGLKREVRACCNEASIKMTVVQTKTSALQKSQLEMEKQIKTNWTRTAEEMVKKAKELNKPPATFECIKKAHATAVSRLEALTSQFQTEIKKLEKRASDVIRGHVKNLNTTSGSIDALQAKGEEQVKECRDFASLRQTMERLGKEIALVSVGAKKEVQAAGQAAGQFISEASALYSRTAQQGKEIEEEGHSTMKNCVWGENLEEAKKQALLKLKGTSTEVEKQVQFWCNEASMKMTLVQNKTSTLVKSQLEMEKQIKTNWNKTAEEMAKKAKEMNKPPATYECIKKAHAYAVSRLVALGSKFQRQLKDLENDSVASIQGHVKALKATQTSLGARYEKAATEVKACKDGVVLKQVTERLEKEFGAVRAEAKKELEIASQDADEFAREASASHSRVARLSGKMEEEGHRTMKNCVW